MSGAQAVGLGAPNSVGRALAILWRWTVIAAEFGVLVVVSVVNALHFSYDNGAVVIAFAFLVVGYGLIGVAVHELGHALAAWLFGWHVHLIVIWRLAFAPKTGRFQFFAARPRQDIGGWVLATPQQDAGWSKGTVPFILGGAAGNIAFAVLCFAAAVAAQEPGSSLFVVLVWLGEISTIQAVANLVPVSRPDRWKNDGARLVAAIRGEGFASDERLVMRLGGMRYDRVPVEEWDPIIREILEADPPVYHESLDPLLFDYTLGSADLLAARRIIEGLLERKHGLSEEYRCVHAFIVAMIDRDASEASDILDQVSSRRVRSSFSYWRARAVVDHLSGRREAAFSAVPRAREAAKRHGIKLDEEDEGVLRAIEQGETLPTLRPRPGYVSLAPFFEQRAVEQEPRRHGEG